ncbi:hypothetical protein AWB67_04766 [Caballeronia terrestris]|uniref:Lipoprotein n=1 Tax=Caballeronia terrestris TaxID=1226301 RepID=A0A158K2Z2_9BURK|nr:hypothetical protein [Caballeronia terrestris]SAL75467.1 hypothetical protein AWB67_04766 [Caballeronia terrestris]
MKKLVAALSITAACACAHASDYGCKVLLCLANPGSNGGAKGMAQCEQPIDQLYHDLSKGRPFPTCDMSDGNDGSSYARQVYDQYDPCPAPLQAVLRGSYVTEGRPKTSGATVEGWGGDGSYVLTGPPQVSEQGDYGNASGPRACVGKSIGLYSAGSFDNPYTVNVFDKVIWQPAQTPRAIDVFIDNRWQQRVRW